MNLLKRFIKYVKMDTQSNPNNLGIVPTTSKQFSLANILAEELTALGLKDVEVDKHCFVYGTLEANTTKKLDTIGFLAHLDTSPDASGANVNPRIIENYDGGKIVLNSNLNIILDPNYFETLKKQIGHTLITADGTTLLGADDKAGIAEIMQMLQYLTIHKKIEHGKIIVAFTPDEECGGGIHLMNLEKFNVDYAFTVDGGAINQINYECFNAASAKIKITGIEVHPGTAKGKMVHASMIGMEFHQMLPVFERPEFTENYEGFNHLCDFIGGVDKAELTYIIRNHDAHLFEKQKMDFINAKNFINQKYNNVLELEIKDQYRNMKELILKDSRCLHKVTKAFEKLGLTCQATPIRGGTDGSALTYLGINTPNLGTGGYNYHGIYEYASLNEMEEVVKILINIVSTF